MLPPCSIVGDGGRSYCWVSLLSPLGHRVFFQDLLARAGSTGALGLLFFNPLLSFAKLGIRPELSHLGKEKNIRWQETPCFHFLPSCLLPLGPQGNLRLRVCVPQPCSHLEVSVSPT